ncbi:MAG: RimK family alpha-L-glutamate ligase [Planctomycetales bacterium]
MPSLSSDTSIPIQHYWWAGLDFMIDQAGSIVLIEANRSSHMLGEYQEFVGDDLPFALTAEVMNRAGGTPCLLWRRGEPFPDADEDACYIARHLSPHLREAPVVCDVEDNQEPRTWLMARDGRRVSPGSIFRWWYGLPWSFERAGVRVINPNCAWLAVRDKLHAYTAVSGAATFRVPRSFAVSGAVEAARIMADHPESFHQGFVLKPRVGWGGQGVQIGSPGDWPVGAGVNYLLSERIMPRLADGRFWEVRVFVMAGRYLGGIRHANQSPQTNYWQGGRPEALDRETSDRLRQPALEAVALLDAASDVMHRQEPPPRSVLTEVEY